jgi:glycosyltransferase involved in cell wall biosynthesis
MQKSEKALNILISAAGFLPYSFGGGEAYVYYLAKELKRRKYNISILTQFDWNGIEDSPYVKRYDYNSIQVTAFSISPKYLGPKESETGIGTITTRVLRKILSELSPDIVHINGIKPNLVALCNELNISHLVTAHHMGIACPAGGLLRSDYSICDKPMHYRDCVPCCCYLRTSKWYTGGLLGRTPPWIYRPIGKALNRVKNLPYLGRGLIYPWLIEKLVDSQKTLLSRAKHFIAPSRAVEELLTRNGCLPTKITILPHGIEPINKLPFEPFQDHPIRFGYVGRIDPSKGLHVLLEGVEGLSNGELCELHIFGAARNPWDEDHRKKTLLNYGGKPKVFDHGLIPPERLREAYQSIDVLVVPSILPEAFGLVVAEAFSAGRPAIVANSGALQEQVRDGVDGFIVERNNSKALTEAMQKFIENPNLVLEMSNQIRPVKTILQYVDEIEKIYHQLISSKN